MTTTPTNNNLLVGLLLQIKVGGVTVSSIVQTGVTWTRQIAEYGGSGNNLNMEIWAGLIEASGTPSTSASVTLSGSVHEAIGEMFEFSGLATSSFLDKTATNANVSGFRFRHRNHSDNNSAAELWFGAVAIQLYTTITYPTNGFTMLDGAAGNYGYVSQAVDLQNS